MIIYKSCLKRLILPLQDVYCHVGYAERMDESIVFGVM